MKHHRISPQNNISHGDKNQRTNKNAKQKKKFEEHVKSGKISEKTKQKFYKPTKLENTKSTVPFFDHN